MDTFTKILSKGGLSLDRLNNFCHIAAAGGIARAANGNAAKQSLYSRQIRELEEFFNVQLKCRHGKGLVLTEAGQKLARLVRAHLVGLDDFVREAKALPPRVSIGAGNSVLEWWLLPRIKQLKKALPGAVFKFHAAETRFVINKLTDMTLDLGIVRRDAVPRHLKSIRLRTVNYRLFVAKKLAAGVNDANLKERIAQIPIATSMGGQFRETLERLAGRARWQLKIEVSCSSFTQATRVAQSGACGAILPDIADLDFDAGAFVTFRLPFLESYARQLDCVWNPRLVEVRPFLATLVQAIKSD